MNDPLAFNLKSALAGISFPEETVTVFLDAGLMYEYNKAKREWDYDPSNEEKKAEVERLEELFKGIALKVTVRDLPSAKRQAVAKKVREEFPPTVNAFGMAMDSPEAVNARDEQLWALYITRIVTPDGQEFTPGPEDIRALREEAPDIALTAIASAINGLTEGAKSGYEQIVQGLDFLSQPSQTE